MKIRENAEYQTHRSWLNAGSVVTILTAALLPKCPLCLIALFSAFGISAGIGAKVLFPLTVIFVLSGIGIMYWQAGQKRNFTPFYLAVIAGVFMLAGKFYFSGDSLFYAGAGLFAIAVLWNNLTPDRTKSRPKCRC